MDAIYIKYLVAETVVALLRRHDYCISGYSSVSGAPFKIFISVSLISWWLDYHSFNIYILEINYKDILV